MNSRLHSAQTFDEFSTIAKSNGFDETLVREWQASQVTGEHTHPFSVSARVDDGEFWLTCDGTTKHLSKGDVFSLDANVPHSERYGAQGARVWVARKLL
jgi:quercetin dioxygenase-like cupin family protein